MYFRHTLAPLAACSLRFGSNSGTSGSPSRPLARLRPTRHRCGFCSAVAYHRFPEWTRFPFSPARCAPALSESIVSKTMGQVKRFCKIGEASIALKPCRRVNDPREWGTRGLRAGIRPAAHGSGATQRRPRAAADFVILHPGGLEAASRCIALENSPSARPTA